MTAIVGAAYAAHIFIFIDKGGWMPVSNGRPAGESRTAWRKSTRSNPSGDCVEIAVLPDGGIALRDSRDPSGPALISTRAGIRAFAARIKADDFHHLTHG